MTCGSWNTCNREFKVLWFGTGCSPFPYVPWPTLASAAVPASMDMVCNRCASPIPSFVYNGLTIHLFILDVYSTMQCYFLSATNFHAYSLIRQLVSITYKKQRASAFASIMYSVCVLGIVLHMRDKLRLGSCSCQIFSLSHVNAAYAHVSA